MNLWFLLYVFIASQLIIVTTSINIGLGRRRDMVDTLVEGAAALLIYLLMALAVVVIEPEKVAKNYNIWLIFFYIVSRVVTIGGGLLAIIFFVGTVSELMGRGKYDLDLED